jgi:hypothetical protein
MSDMSTAEPWHDPELPFLAVLEQEVRRKAQRAAFQHEQRQHLSLAVQHSHRSAAQRLGREQAQEGAARLRGRVPAGSLRFARRSLTLVALLCLIAASAFGASKVFSGSPSNPLMPSRGVLIPVAAGTSGHDPWSLRLYVRGGELCRVLSVPEGEASQCAGAPANDGIEVSSEQSPEHRYVFGVAGAGVARVRVKLGDISSIVAARALDAAQVRIGRLPAHVRFWVDVLPRAAHGELTAQVDALGFDGRSLGSSVPSCLETDEPGRC